MEDHLGSQPLWRMLIYCWVRIDMFFFFGGRELRTLDLLFCLIRGILGVVESWGEEIQQSSIIISSCLGFKVFKARGKDSPHKVMERHS